MSEVTFLVKWNGKTYPITVSSEETFLALKLKIRTETNVLPKRQKLFGIKHKGKTPADDVLIGALRTKKRHPLRMTGTPEEEIAPEPEDVEGWSDVTNDLDVVEETLAVKDSPIYLEKLRKRSSTYDIKQLNEPRDGKKLLVLDIDYTLFDHRSTVERAEELMRPYLHEFLTAVYPFYDIAIWSATSMKWIELKMKELGVLSNPNYKLLCLVDSKAMITIHTERYGVFGTKPLGVIWENQKYKGRYTSTNTIMFDDLRRNFIMNPQNGLKIRPFRDAPANMATDKELMHLTEYLLFIKDLDDFSSLKHKKWESYVLKARERNS